MLALAVGLQRFEAIAGRHTQITQHSGLILEAKFPQSDVLEIRRQFSTPASRPDQFCLGIREALNHN